MYLPTSYFCASWGPFLLQSTAIKTVLHYFFCLSLCSVEDSRDACYDVIVCTLGHYFENTVVLWSIFYAQLTS